MNDKYNVVYSSIKQKKKNNNNWVIIIILLVLMGLIASILYSI